MMKNWIKQKMRILLRPMGRIILFYIFMFVIIGLAAWVCYKFIYNWPEMDKKYKPEKIVISDETDVRLASYRYYLDFSPSMEGFIASSEGGMKTLSSIFESIHKDETTISYFRCYDNIDECDATMFYNSMRDVNNIRELYKQFEVNKEQNEVLSGLDLTKVFSDKWVNDSDEVSYVNLILTDLNFFDTVNGSSTHDERMGRFVQRLTEIACASDICIYQFNEEYQGNGIDGVIFSEDNKDLNPMNSPLFLIVFSENTTEYEKYIKELEMYLKQENTIKFNKMEFRNAFLQDSHLLQVDDSVLYSKGISKANFHYNNKWIKNREAYEIGLYISGENSSIAIFRGNVAELNIEALGHENLADVSKCVIKTNVKTFYPNDKSGLREYIESQPLELLEAGIVWDNNKKKYYLNIWMKCDIQVDFPETLFYNKDYFVAEVQFFIDRPVYAIPEWIDELDTEETFLNLQKRRKIKELAQSLADKKADFFMSNAEMGEKYMGALVFYISR